MNNIGRFVISLDTELGWGSFDKGGLERYEDAYKNTDVVIDGLCNLFDKYRVPVTWALVTHLFDECNDHSELISPDYDWVDWTDEMPCSRDVSKEFWYNPGILERIRSTDTNHEIGIHGYSHVDLGAPGCSPDAARFEVGKAIDIAERAGIDPKTYVFPRNSIGHLDVLREFDIQIYRNVDDYWYERALPKILKKPFRFADELFTRSPPVVSPTENEGLVALPGSQILRPYRGPWRYTPANSQLIRAQKGLDLAAMTGKVFHLWFHPFNIALDQDRHLDLLEDILSYATKLRDRGTLHIGTMAETVGQND